MNIALGVNGFRRYSFPCLSITLFTSSHHPVQQCKLELPSDAKQTNSNRIDAKLIKFLKLEKLKVEQNK